MRSLVTVAWSVVVWSALWGTASTGNAVSGALVGLLVLWLVPVEAAGREALRFSPVAGARFALFFIWALLRASAVVAWEVVTPKNQINEGIVRVPLSTSSPAILTLVANTVSLTPGTLTVEVGLDPPRLYVHVLHLRAIEDVRADIRRLESLALKAFRIEPTEEAGP